MGNKESLEGVKDRASQKFKRKTTKKVDMTDALLDQPWRRSSWIPQEVHRKKQDLLRRITQYVPVGGVLPKARILLIGQVGVGKSSFVQSASLALGSSYQTMPGSAQYKSHQVKDTDGTALKFILSECRGLEPMGSGGIRTEDVANILKGHVGVSFQFKALQPGHNGKGFKRNPLLADKVHCLVYVLEAATMGDISQSLQKKIKAIQEQADELGIPELVLLTKVDEACPAVQEKLTEIYWSKSIAEKTQHVAELLDIPISHILPVKNHPRSRPDPSTDILVLTALYRMLHSADGFLEDLN
ncbi:interferon-induced protein 44-like isoform X1 [Erpetoichthys calabaricus]|uniref:Interferon-induced protein 44-like n=1 Tax=Erpetoichthys calabaricus TaxID=27687 RepID=A0A8C4SVS9_ERPCA|nr:interferon-induced protein 44-like isoform X1 [Erpetoichthys calabaricus]XP_051788714.1 interferon-induced protein 44-like isoform X1 [Erpetoichthys calabaricus]